MVSGAPGAEQIKLTSSYIENNTTIPSNEVVRVSTILIFNRTLFRTGALIELQNDSAGRVWEVDSQQCSFVNGDCPRRALEGLLILREL